MSTDIVVPQLGNEITEAEVPEWLVAEGTQVAEGDPVVTLTTTKMAIDIEAPAAGTLGKPEVDEGELVGVGTVLARIA